MHYYHNKPLGITFIVLGLIAFFIAVAPLLFPILLALVGLYLINLGLRLIGKPPLTILLQQIWIGHSWYW